MSHFSVIVATTDFPTDEVLGRELQPYHEFECTGNDDQYVKEIDETDALLAEYEKAATSMLKDPDGALHAPYDDRFYREPTDDEAHKIGPIAGTGFGHGISWTSKDWGDGRGYRAKVRFVPEGWHEVDVPCREIESFRDFVCSYHGKETVAFGSQPDLAKTHKYGYALLNERGEVTKVVDRTNPNGKWDYWRVGGRYTGKLQGRGGKQAAPSREWRDDQPPSGLDICQKRNLDMAAMKSAAVARRQECVDECCQKCGLTPDQLEIAVAENRRAHAEWLPIPEPRPRGVEYAEWCKANGYALAGSLLKSWDTPEPHEGQTVAEWIAAAPVLSAFAFVRDGKWYAQGDMGWWAAVHNRQEDWPAVLQQLLSEVPDHYWLSIVDCHC